MRTLPFMAELSSKPVSKANLIGRKSRSPTRTNQSFCRESSNDNSSKYTHRARRVPSELLFTPVNSLNENWGPTKSTESMAICSSQPSSKYRRDHVRTCRLIGFTPLADKIDDLSGDESGEFLGPRKVKAKEVAPCALFYKRSDVFVSSEMKSQNVLAYSENHYRKIQFDDGASIKELEYVPEPCEQAHEVFDQPSPKLGADDWDRNQISRKEALNPNIRLGPLDFRGRRFIQSFSKDGLTTMPLASRPDSDFTFHPDNFHISGDEADGALGPNMGAKQNFPWSDCLHNPPLASDPEQSTSSASSSGIQTSLWDAATISSLTRATSPVSSIYSNTYHLPPTNSSSEDQDLVSECELPNFSNISLEGAEKEDRESSPTDGYPDWQDDNGVMADDENDSDCSSLQAESDEDQDLSEYKKICFQYLPSTSLSHSKNRKALGPGVKVKKLGRY